MNELLSEQKQQANKRLQGLLELQKELDERFDAEQYNIFVFGSYVTIAYQEGKSDIDLAIYCKNFSLYKQIAAYLDDYFEQRQIPCDIFYINIDMPAPVYVAPLRSHVYLTDYFPQELQDFLEQCEDSLKKIKMEFSL